MHIWRNLEKLGIEATAHVLRSGFWLFSLVPTDVAQTNGVGELPRSSKQSGIWVLIPLQSLQQREAGNPLHVFVFYQESSAALLLAPSSILLPRAPAPLQLPSISLTICSPPPRIKTSRTCDHFSFVKRRTPAVWGDAAPPVNCCCAAFVNPLQHILKLSHK